MTFRLLTEHLSLKGGGTDSSRVYTCQNATLLEITSRLRWSQEFKTVLVDADELTKEVTPIILTSEPCELGRS